MAREGMTVREAAEEWVREFNAIPGGMIDRLMRLDPDDWREVTTPAYGDRVYVFELPDGCGSEKDEGRIDSYDEESGRYCIELDDGVKVSLESEDFEVDRDTMLPMWSRMWSFRDSANDYWLEKMGGIAIMSRCGFRVYESEDFGYFFGIDGAGYDFYEKHWIPLYQARGLRWHDPDTEKAS